MLPLKVEAKMMGKLYNCKELEIIENINNEIYGIVSWPVEDNYDNLYIDYIDPL